MATEVFRIEPQGDSTAVVRDAAKVLADGGLVAFPTETVYGLGADASNAEAVARLRSVKGRSPETAFTVHIGRPGEVHDFVPRLNGLAGRLIRKAWPGPLTIILDVEEPSAAPIWERLGESGGAAVYYERTVGIRCPDDRVAEALLQATTGPVVATSANLAGRRPPETAEDVLRDLDGRIDVVLDGGKAKYARPSTIVKVQGRAAQVIRDGVYDARTIERLSMLRILFICTGNTCRSPMAAGIATQAVAQRLGCSPADVSANGVVVSSAGTAGGVGAVSEHAVTVMKKRRIDLSNHSSVAVTDEMIRQADHLFVMTHRHRDVVVGLVPSAEERVALLLGDEDIADPFGGSEGAYEQCARSIEQGVHERLKEVIA